MIEIYVDGSVNNYNYSGAFAVFEDGKLIHEACGIGTSQELKKMRNISGELSAAVKAAKWLIDNQKTGIIVYDYKGIEKFATGAWETLNPYIIQYKEFMQPLIHEGIVDFRYVKGHSKVYGNELADRLAKRALRLGIMWEDKW